MTSRQNRRRACVSFKSVFFFSNPIAFTFASHFKIKHQVGYIKIDDNKREKNFVVTVYIAFAYKYKNYFHNSQNNIYNNYKLYRLISA